MTRHEIEEGRTTASRAARKQANGFTLIELLVVIAIIGLLSSVVLASLSSARGKAKDARRTSDLKQIQVALELYYDSNRAYPSTGGTWRSQCAAWGSHPANNVIPGLAPNYLPTIPADPDMNAGASLCCYLYISGVSGNTNDYKLLDHNCPSLNYQSAPSLIDPARDGGSNACTVDGTGIWSWAIFSSGNSCGW